MAAGLSGTCIHTHAPPPATSQGDALQPGQLAAEESLVAPPVQRLLRRLGLGWLPGAGGLAGVQVAVAPKLSTLVGGNLLTWEQL